MKIKILLFLMTLLFAVTKANAQAHNLQPGWCKYAKKVKGQARDESASAVCQVCKKENEKEQIAKAAEDKRRNDVVVAKVKADKAASDLAYKKKQQEIAENNKSTEVSIIIPKSPPVKNITLAKKTLPKKQNNITKGVLLISDKNGGFKSIKNEVIIPENTYAKTKGAQYFENINKNNFPKDLGIVTFSERISVPDRQCGAGNYYRSDFINSKGEGYFNSDAISFIEHMQNDWFIVGSDFYGTDTYYDKLGSAKLYNVKTKKEFQLPISPWHNAVIIYNSNTNSVSNPCYITATYISPTKKRGLRETLLDNLTGGNDQWKAYIFLQISLTRGNTEFKVVYLNKNDEIKELSISDEDRVNFKMN